MVILDIDDFVLALVEGRGGAPFHFLFEYLALILELLDDIFIFGSFELLLFDDESRGVFLHI